MQTGQRGAMSWREAFLAVFIIGWTLSVLVYLTTIAPEQRVLAGLSLLVVGAMIAGMGYLSLTRRRAMVHRQASVQRMLERRRREKGPGADEGT